MRSKLCKLSASVTFVTLAIASAAVAQEFSHKVQIQSSELNVRWVGRTAITNPMGSKLAGSVPRESMLMTAQESQLVKMHYLAHHWGRVMAEQRAGFAAQAQIIAPSVTPVPIIARDRNFSGFTGLTGAEQASVSGGDLEPPDQGLCTNGNVVLEPINVAASVYQASSHKVLAGPVYLNDFFGVPGTDFTSDPRCYYDPPTERWFVTVTDLSSTSLLLAVSQTSDPIGFFDVYAIDVGNDGFFSVCPCYGDQPLIGADDNGFYISTNSFGAVFFGGAQIYALSKFALVLGIVPFGVHLSPLPAPGGPIPFSLQPAASPSGQGAAVNGGTEYFVSSYDINSQFNSKVSVWAMTNTATLSAVPGVPGFTTLAVNTEAYVLPIPASQKVGPIPLGKSLGQPEETLDPDDQRMQQAVFADGNLWSSLGTALQVSGKTVDGAAYFVIKPSWKSDALQASVTRQGYIATANNNLLYPAVGVSGTGNGAIVFTLTGPNYFPSAAYIPISLATGVAANGIRLAAAGALPEDGFSGYTGECGPCGPPARWGDYSAAVALGDDSVWLATEYISSKPRDKYTNWSTFIGVLPLPDGD